MMSRAFATNGSLNGFAGTHMSAGVLGSGNGTIMSSIGLHQPMNGSVGTPASTVAPGLDFGGMMGSIIQDALNGSTDASTTGSSIVQTMLDIMDDMPGIHLVGLAHMNLFDAAVS